MTTSLSANDKSNPNGHTKSVELFHVIWLDDDNSGSNQNVEDILRSTIIQVTKFQDVILCRQYIENVSGDNRLLLLISSHLSNEIIPVIHKLEQVSFICVYGINSITDDQWLEQFSKVE